MLEGLQGKADLNSDGYTTVKELTDSRQTPQTIIPGSIPDFAMAVKRLN